jgi:hypothetical protein
MKNLRLKVTRSIAYSTCLFLSLAHGKAQTLTATNFNPSSGDSIVYQTAGYESPGPSGLNQLWNFSAIIPDGVNFTLKYTQPLKSSPAQHSLATITRIKKNEAILLKTDSTGIYSLGSQVSGFFASNTPVYPDVIMPFPISFGTTHTNTAYWAENNTLTNSTTNITADATGTLITPSGTYNNVIRLKKELTLTSQLPYQPSKNNVTSTLFYEWYSPGVKGPIMSIIIHDMGRYDLPKQQLVHSVEKWTEIYNDKSQIPLAIENESFFHSYFTFCNPVNKLLSLHAGDAPRHDVYNAKILNIEGKVIHEATFEDNAQINVSAINNGIYILEVSDSSKNLFRKKILILNE